jgi:hypothetical protein
MIGLEPSERGLGHLLDVLWTAVLASALSRLGVDIVAELRRDHHLVAERADGVADEFFVGERTISFGGVEKADATLVGGPDQLDCVVPVGRRAISPIKVHAAEAEGRYFQRSQPAAGNGSVRIGPRVGRGLPLRQGVSASRDHGQQRCYRDSCPGDENVSPVVWGRAAKCTRGITVIAHRRSSSRCARFTF